jgi:hypothetical protein
MFVLLSSRQDEARDERQRQLSFLHVSYISYNDVLMSGAVEIDVVLVRPAIKDEADKKSKGRGNAF